MEKELSAMKDFGPSSIRDPWTVLQLTDPHLYADPGGLYDGLNTSESLRAVLTLAQARQWPPDALVLTGDLSQDGSRAAYARLRECIGCLGVPVYCLPGNHDDKDAMRQVLPGGNIHVVVDAPVGEWRCVFLDTAVAGREHGHLSAEQIARLDERLSAETGHPALVFMHHHPVVIGSLWMDEIGVDNSPAFFEVLDRHTQVRAVLWGHIHQEFAALREGVQLLGTPSTCVQFTPRTDRHQRDTLSPGYRWLRLWRDGRLETGIERLEH